MNKKVLYSVAGALVLIVGSSVVITFASNHLLYTQKPVMVAHLDPIAERKKDLGLDYKIVLDRPVNQQRGVRSFNAVIVPTSPKPTVEQLKALGEIIKDQYQDEQFLTVALYDNETAASTETNVANVEDVKSHILAMYDKAVTTGLNQLRIYPEGYGPTKYEDIVTINY